MPRIGNVDLAALAEELQQLRSRVDELERERGEDVLTFRSGEAGEHVALVPRDLGTPPGTLRQLLEERDELIAKIQDGRRRLEGLELEMAGAAEAAKKRSSLWPASRERARRADDAYARAYREHQQLQAAVKAAENELQALLDRISQLYVPVAVGRWPELGLPRAKT